MKVKKVIYDIFKFTRVTEVIIHFNQHFNNLFYLKLHVPGQMPLIFLQNNFKKTNQICENHFSTIVTSLGEPKLSKLEKYKKVFKKPMHFKLAHLYGLMSTCIPFYCPVQF